MRFMACNFISCFCVRIIIFYFLLLKKHSKCDLVSSGRDTQSKRPPGDREKFCDLSKLLAGLSIPE